jgi:uncharacterized damage-inducible protein DinB
VLVQLREAFAHHAWATEQLLDRCAELSDDELTRHVPAIYGSTLDTFRHLVDADNWYLACISRGDLGERDLDCDDHTLDQLRTVADANAAGWTVVLDRDLDVDEVLTVVRKDGSTTAATFGIRLAQVLHHGSDHRSQIATALTTLGHGPPEFDVWYYGWTHGLVTETDPDPG